MIIPPRMGARNRGPNQIVRINVRIPPNDVQISGIVGSMRQLKAGFTLVELMIVMIIMGILVLAGVGSFISSQKRSRDTKRKNDLRQG